VVIWALRRRRRYVRRRLWRRAGENLAGSKSETGLTKANIIVTVGCTDYEGIKRKVNRRISRSRPFKLVMSKGGFDGVQKKILRALKQKTA
jgi:hypothetical protein